MSAGQEIGSPIRENRTLLPAPLPPDDAPGTLAAAAGVSTVGLRPPFDTPAAAFSSRLSRHSHLDCRARQMRLPSRNRGRGATTRTLLGLGSRGAPSCRRRAHEFLLPPAGESYLDEEGGPPSPRERRVPSGILRRVSIATAFFPDMQDTLFTYHVEVYVICEYPIYNEVLLTGNSEAALRPAAKLCL